MRKILFMFISLVGVLCITPKVEAAEATCVYPQSAENPNYFTVTIKDDAISVLYNVSSPYIVVNNTLTVNNFTNSDNQLECLNEISYKLVYGHNATFTISPSSGDVVMNLDSSRSTVTNDEKPGEEPEKILLKCSYSNNFLIKTDKQIKVELADGCDVISKPTYEEIGDVCPEVVHITSGNKGQMYCSFSLNPAPHSLSEQYLLDAKVQDADNLNNPEGSETDNEYIYESNDSESKVDYEEGCGIFSNSIKEWLIKALDIIKIAALVLTIILGMLDFFRGVASGNADAMKKMWKNFSTRLIVVVILFLLPVIIEFLLGLVTIEGIEPSNPLCGIK